MTMTSVTKTQTVNFNKALVRCIAGGKACYVEMDRPPAHAGNIKTELLDGHVFNRLITVCVLY